MTEGGEDIMGGEQPALGQQDQLEHAFNTLRQEVRSVNVILGVQGAAQNINRKYERIYRDRRTHQNTF